MRQMQNTSLLAFFNNQETLSKMEQKVFDCFEKFEVLTLYDIVKILDLPVNNISGRITGLYKKKKIYDTGSRGKTPSGNSCILWSKK